MLRRASFRRRTVKTLQLGKFLQHLTHLRRSAMRAIVGGRSGVTVASPRASGRTPPTARAAFMVSMPDGGCQ
jgi:hypothetical protein